MSGLIRGERKQSTGESLPDAPLPVINLCRSFTSLDLCQLRREPGLLLPPFY